MLAEYHCYLSYGGKRNEKRKSVFLYYSLVQPTPIMMMKHPSPILHLATTTERFLFHCRYEKNLNEKTIKAYSTDLEQFKNYMAESLNIKDLRKIRPDSMKHYLNHYRSSSPKLSKEKWHPLRQCSTLSKWKMRVSIIR